MGGRHLPSLGCATPIEHGIDKRQRSPTAVNRISQIAVSRRGHVRGGQVCSCADCLATGAVCHVGVRVMPGSNSSSRTMVYRM